jgi:hypothetical protein
MVKMLQVHRQVNDHVMLESQSSAAQRQTIHTDEHSGILNRSFMRTVIT